MGISHGGKGKGRTGSRAKEKSGGNGSREERSITVARLDLQLLLCLRTLARDNMYAYTAFFAHGDAPAQHCAQFTQNEIAIT